MEVENQKIAEAIKNLENLIFGKMSGLNHTFRFSGQRKLRNQSVAEHSYWTAIIAVALARYENEMRKINGESIASLDIEKLYDMCLFHDVDEVVTGDLNHRFKHSQEGADFRKEFSKLLDVVVPKVLFSNILMGKKISESWHNSHNDDEYNYFLKMGDWLQLLQYAVEEVELGNKKFYSKVLRVVGLIKDKNKKFLIERRYTIMYAPVLVEKFINNFIMNFEKELSI